MDATVNNKRTKNLGTEKNNMTSFVASLNLRQFRRRKSLSQRVVSGSLAALEGIIIVGISLALFAVYVEPTNPHLFSQYLGAIALYTLFTWQALYMANLYRLNKYIAPLASLPKILFCIWIAFLLLASVAFALKISDQFSRVWIFSWMVVISVLVPVFRVAASIYIRRSALTGMLTKDIAIYGAGENCTHLIKHIQSLGQPWLRIVGVFDDRTVRVPRECGEYLVRGGTDDLIEFTQKHGCDEVLLAMPPASRDRYLQLTEKLRPLPVNLRIVPDLTIISALNYPEPSASLLGMPTIDLLRKPVGDWGAVVKRTMDVLFTGFFLLLAVPFIGLIALLIKLESRGPVFFRQKRYGFQNEIFAVFKFRSMYVDCTDEYAEKLTTRNDPRVSRVGAWLRRFSLDELPQLFNVLRGDMSLVGPRPHALKAKAGGKLYEDVIKSYGHRIRVKPGLTGWAQVSGWRGNTETERDLEKRVEYDLYYIENWSVMLDVKILLKTFWVVIHGENSY
jgi:Undecaprenyl-phosphate glucose phosphotransferase